MPSQARLAALLVQAFETDSPHALWRHADWCVARYRDGLQAFSPASWLRPDRPGPQAWQGRWAGESVLAVPQWGLELRMSEGKDCCSDGFVVDRSLLEREPLGLSAPSARLRVRPGSKSHSREVRKRWQELGVPPWLRGWLPEVRVGDVTLGVAGLGAAAALPAAGKRAAAVALSVRLSAPGDPRASWVMPYN